MSNLLRPPGIYTLAATDPGSPNGQLCLFHTSPVRSGPVRTRVGSGPDQSPSRSNRNRCNRARSGRSLSPSLVRSRALRRSAGMVYGRRRARDRVRSGRFEVHPGWRGRLPDGVEIVAEQAAALQRITELIDAELWCPRQRREWTVMLSAMVWAMDWRTGLITGVSREHLAATVGRSVRSVSRMWRWAHDTGLLIRVEEGASAQWLGTRRNRSASFVLVDSAGTQASRQAARDSQESAQLTGFVEQSGNPPVSYAEIDPLRRNNHSQKTATDRWLWRRIPETPSQRRAAATELLRRTGLEARGVDPRRVHGLLLSWWDAGASPAGLLYMLDHHPDHPHLRRGPAFDGARDPLAVMGYRLAPWTARLTELPPTAQGHKGDYLAAQKARLAALIDAAATATPATVASPSSRPLSASRTRPRTDRVVPRPIRRSPRSPIEPQPGLSTYERARARARNEARTAPERRP